MCVSPVRRNAATKSGDRPDVSPSTRPGSKPRGPLGSGAAAARKPVLMWPATTSGSDARPIEVGGPRASNTAVTSSPGIGTLSLPAAVTRCVGCRSSHPRAVVSTTIGELIAIEPSGVVTTTARAVKTTSCWVKVDDPAERCGSLVTTSTSVTEVCARASCGNGPRCTAATRHAAAAAAPAAQIKATARTRARTCRRSRCVIHAVTSPGRGKGNAREQSIRCGYKQRKACGQPRSCSGNEKPQLDRLASEQRGLATHHGPRIASRRADPSRRQSTRHTFTRPTKPGVLRRTDARHLLQLADAREPTMLSTPVENLLCCHGADSGQRLELCERRRVQVDDGRCGTAPNSAASVVADHAATRLRGNT